MGGPGTLPREPFLTSSKNGDPILHPPAIFQSIPFLTSVSESLPPLETSPLGSFSVLNVWEICPFCLIQAQSLTLRLNVGELMC